MFSIYEKCSPSLYPFHIKGETQIKIVNYVSFNKKKNSTEKLAAFL